MISKRFSLSGSFRDFRWALKSFKVFLALHYFSRVVQNRDVNSERLIGGKRQKKSGKGQQKARKRQKKAKKKKLSKADDILGNSLVCSIHYVAFPAYVLKYQHWECSLLENQHRYADISA